MTGNIEAYGHFWKLMIFPRENMYSNTNVEHVSIYLYSTGDNANTESLILTGYIRTKVITRQIPTNEFSKGRNSGYGWKNFAKREDIINWDNKGTFAITIEIEDAPTIFTKDIIVVDENTVQCDMHICHFAKLQLRRGECIKLTNKSR